MTPPQANPPAPESASDREDLRTRLRRIADHVQGDTYSLPRQSGGLVDFLRTPFEQFRPRELERFHDADLDRVGILVDIEAWTINRRIQQHGMRVLVYLDGNAHHFRLVAGTPGQDFELAKASLSKRITEGPPPKRRHANDNDASSKPRPRHELTWFDDIEDDAPKDWIIKGVVGAGEHAVISGLPGTGKSVVATDAACHVAAGMEWFGHPVEQGLVVYVAAERKKLTERRMMAFRKHHGVSGLPLVVIGGRWDFTSSLADAGTLAILVRQAEEKCGQPCVWVIVDTLTRTFGPGDQNASKDMGRFVQSCDEIIRQTGAHLTIIHHTAWSGERGKGAIDLDGAVDSSFLVSKSGNVFTLKCDGTNDGEEGTVATFTMKPVTLAVDDAGDATTAPVVMPCETLSGRFNSSGHARHVLAALHDAIAGEGVDAEGPNFPEGVKVVTDDQWRAAYYESEPNVARGTMQKRFSRAKDDLITNGSVDHTGQWFRPI